MGNFQDKLSPVPSPASHRGQEEGMDDADWSRWCRRAQIAAVAAFRRLLSSTAASQWRANTTRTTTTQPDAHAICNFFHPWNHVIILLSFLITKISPACNKVMYISGSCSIIIVVTIMKLFFYYFLAILFIDPAKLLIMPEYINCLHDYHSYWQFIY